MEECKDGPRGDGVLGSAEPGIVRRLLLNLTQRLGVDDPDDPWIRVQRTAFAHAIARLIPEARNVLDLGAGDGSIGRYILGELGPDARITMVDLLPPTADLPERASWIQGDANHLPFEDASFDAVLMKALLHHVDDPTGTLTEAFRVLKPNGTVIVVEANRENRVMRLIAENSPPPPISGRRTCRPCSALSGGWSGSYFNAYPFYFFFATTSLKRIAWNVGVFAQLLTMRGAPALGGWAARRAVRLKDRLRPSYTMLIATRG